MKKLLGIILTLVIGWFVLVVLIYGLIGYVAVHFLGKVW